MATIIDALLVTLGLDASGMKKGANEAAQAQDKIAQDAEKSAASATASGKKRDAAASSATKKRSAEESAALKKQAAEQAKATKEREAQAKKIAEGLAKVRNEVLSIGAALFGMAAIKGIGQELISTDLQVKRLSETLDVGVSKLSAWQNAGAKFGASADEVADAFRKANTMQMEFNRGNAEPVKDIMMQAGMEKIPFDTKILDKATSAEDRLKRLANVAQKMTATGAQYAFGKAGFSEADIRMLRAGGDQLDVLVKHFQALNPDVEGAAKGSEELAGKWVEVAAQAKGIGNSILEVLLPALKLGLDALTAMMTYAREHVPATTALVGALGTAFLMLSGKAMMSTVSILTQVVSGLGAASAAATGTAAAVGATSTAVTGFTATIGLLFASLGKLTIAGAAGYALGSAIYDGLISGTKMGDFIGEVTASVAALFGNKEAQAAINASEAKRHPERARPAAGGGMPVVNGKTAAQLNEEIMRGGAGAPLPGIKNARPNISPKGDAQGDIAQLMGLGWTREQAAGIVANLQRESQGNDKAVGDNGQAYGLAQWHPDRQANFAKFAGKDIRQSSHAEQIAFVDHELRRGTEQRAGRELAKTTSAAAAGDIVSRSYERPRDTNSEAGARAQLAQNLARPQIDRSLVTGAQAAVTNNQTNRVNNSPVQNSNHAETHIGEVHINAPQAKTNGDVATAIGEKMQNYAFASMSNLGLA